MKLLTFAFVVLLVCSSVPAVFAQDTGSWVKVSPPDEPFAVLMPQFAEGKTQKHSYEQLEVDARLYSAAEESVVYTVWSLTNRNYQKARVTDAEDYMDACVELVWEVLLKPRREKSKAPTIMNYQRALQAGGLWGREYFMRLGNKQGVVRLFVDGEKIFVLTVFNADFNLSGPLRFLTSFEPDREKAATQSSNTNDTADGTARLILQRGPGRGGNTDLGGQGADNTGVVDYDKVFSPREVTEKARIIYRPEPTYTESARKYRVSGTVVIDAVLSKTGQVTDVQARKKLPHGLTRASIEAATRIKFTPASKNGVPVSQRVIVEYNYNVY